MANTVNSPEEILDDILNLPEEVLIEILIRLPVKSLVRFRCVCKSWLALLKCTHFIDMHLKISLARNDENVLIRRLTEEENKSIVSIHSGDRSLSELVPKLEVQIEGWDHIDLHFTCSSNGLVCGFNSFSGDVILFNPAIGEFRTLPPSPQPCPKFSSWRARGIGFSFDPTSKDYKVIRVMSTELRPFYQDPSFEPCGLVEVYSLSNDTWRELEVVLPRIASFPTGFNLFFNGRIHWCAFNGDRRWILSWNFSTEVFEDLQFPVNDEEEHEGSRFQNLLVVQDHLALIFVTSGISDLQSIDIWIMKEYGVTESWSKQYYITAPIWQWLNRPVTVWKKERLIIEGERLQQLVDFWGQITDVWTSNSQLVMYDIDSEQWENFDIYGVRGTYNVVFYTESLVSVARP